MIRNPIILLLEDEPLIAMSIEDELQIAGFTVAVVRSCHDAAAWLDKTRPDIVIVDVMLTDGPADDVVVRLSQAGIPFVVHSGDPMVTQDESPYASGTWMSKPSSENELAKLAWTLLETYSGIDASEHGATATQLRDRKF